MPLSSSSSLYSKRNYNNIVDQILEQGQRLRNSMVESILNNDPLNTNVINYKYRYDNNNDNSNSCRSTSDDTGKSLSIEEKELFLAYVRGDTMNKIEEKQALDTFGKMSITDVYNLTDRTCLSYKATCNCDTCKAYYNNNNGDNNKEKRKMVPMLNLQNLNGEKCDIESEKSTLPVISLLKYVNSVKIMVHSSLFNYEGLKKINKSATRNYFKLPPMYTHNYFVEYSIPEVLMPSTEKVRAKVDTGLHSNKVKFCSKFIHDDVIHFKQSNIHEIANLNSIELDKLSIKFTISCRTQKQKGISQLGIAKFLMSCFESTKYLTSNQELAIMLDCDAPITIGFLKVSVQLGCDKLYFGKEFIDAICLNKTKNVLLPETINASDTENSAENPTYDKDYHYKETFVTPTSLPDSNYVQSKPIKTDLKVALKLSNRINDVEKESLVKFNVAKKGTEEYANKIIKLDVKRKIIFGFIYISEAEFLNTFTSYFIVRLFGQDDSLYSRIIYNSSNPIYNFQQVIPYMYDDNFIQQLRDNFMIFEFYERFTEGDTLVGICKLSLHKFYVSFRNDYIYDYLLQNELPVIGADWWEPITDNLTGKLYGQVQILIAFGSERQIHNLELNRGFLDERVVVKKTRKLSKSDKAIERTTTRQTSQERTIKQQNTNVKQTQKEDESVTNNKKVTKFKLPPKKKSLITSTSPPPSAKAQANKEDKAVQVDQKMEATNNDDQAKSIINKDTLGEFLTLLMQQRQTNNYVESSTNTEETSFIPQKTEQESVTVKVRQTSQLLDTLQEALSVNSNTLFCNNTVLNETKNTFKAHIHIEKALHLPVKKKCKVKKSKGKHVKHEEIPPSCYVTFETTPSEMIVTPIIQKNCNPIWDYRCDVTLPADLLSNGQKRLIFKIWKKCAGNSSEANLQTDIILGFAALDLTVFLAGLPTVSGWFNILDFSSKCNGQIKIDVTPLENVARFKELKSSDQSEVNSLNDVTSPPKEKPEEVNETVLSRALKRKFIELDEITQRLRLRLSNVTNDDNEPFNDALADEFERDINTLCVEDDYNLIDFEDEETKQSNFSMRNNDGLLQIETDNTSDILTPHSSVLSISMPESVSVVTDKPKFSGTLDKQLKEGRQRIDTLLEKLSIIASETEGNFPSRHVSGCSINQEQRQNNGTLKDFVLDNTNMNVDCIINPLLFQNLCMAGADTDRTSSEELSSENSVDVYRTAPEGARFNNDDKV